MSLAEKSTSQVPRERPGVWASSFRVQLGMPHLAFSGLSEAWLLKELGHRHWRQLARMAASGLPDFYDAAGNIVYAAFRSVQIEDARFDLAKENDTLVIRSNLVRISRTQVQSEHRLTIGGALIGTIRMVSVFVHRNGKSSNRSVVRVEIQGLPPISQAHRSALIRPSVEGTIWDMDAVETAGRRPQVFFPCPSQDFNGAGFLYFANVPAFVDRAEWNVDQDFARNAVTRWRHVTYLANIDPGEAISIEVVDFERSPVLWRHKCRVTRATDGKHMADVLTVRSRVEVAGSRRIAAPRQVGCVGGPNCPGKQRCAAMPAGCGSVSS
ncbi:Pnap_2097 family protein [Stappia sp. MMSF_3263]|uniref:Pnap_2097 family protein n=1 Tax=Stappia sp. MMSF_3263 TaxID=3046693 RepID=UPI00273FA874|nr:Pnap_2097 family protein [Stappia sp. MMSF_3263]